jgi:flagellar assembly protein FliH
MSFVTVSKTRNKAFVEAVLAQDTANAAAQEAEMQRRVRAELAKARAAAESEGRAAGEAAARETLAPRLAAVETAAAALQAAWAQLEAPLAGKEQDLAGLVTELGFLLAKHIVGAEVWTNPESLRGLVAKLLDEAAAARGPRQELRLRLNPVDAEALKAHVPAETATLVPDAAVQAGGALVEIVTPEGDPVDKIEWDATLDGRLGTIQAALGAFTEDEAP